MLAASGTQLKRFWSTRATSVNYRELFALLDLSGMRTSTCSLASLMTRAAVKSTQIGGIDATGTRAVACGSFVDMKVKAKVQGPHVHYEPVRLQN